MTCKQTNDVDFYRELGVIPEFQMTGLGNHGVRLQEFETGCGTHLTTDDTLQR